MSSAGTPDFYFIVVVCHRASPKQQAFSKLAGWVSHMNPKVRLSIIDTAACAQYNEAFEFSGYQAGIQDIARTLATARTPPGSKARIVVLNDTAFDSHLGLLLKMICKTYLHPGTKEFQAASVYGSKVECGISPLPHGLGFYFSTWLFVLDLVVGKMDTLRLYNHSYRDPAEFHAHFELLPMQYRARIDQWLMPRNLLSGWYKASITGRHDQVEINRKRFTIYTEHMLPALLPGQQLQFKSIEEDFGRYRLLQYKAYLLGDRVMTNLHKLAYRMPQIVSMLRKSA